MFLLKDVSHARDTIVLSASDLVLSATCEFAFLRRLDVKLGRDVVIEEVEDEMLRRAGELGDKHEAKQLAAYRAEFGKNFVTEITRPESMKPESLLAKQADTTAAFDSQSEIVFQATFFDAQSRSPKAEGEPTLAFLGFADFIQRVHLPDGRHSWQVQDTKLARSPKPAALIQIAAYAWQLNKLGVDVHPDGVIILGDGTRSVHELSEVTPLFLSRRERMWQLALDGYMRDAVIAWNSPGVSACGRCDVCEPEVLVSRDVLLVAGLRLQQRALLTAAECHTIDQLADLYEAAQSGELNINGINQATLKKLTAQARVQVLSESRIDGKPVVVVREAGALAAIPPPSAGDIFFDFEGDPLYQAELHTGEEVWNLDYLFGLVDNDEKFTAFWAHDFKQEKQALIDFIELVTKLRSEHPDMHIYHYAPYEKTHLKLLAARYGVCEAEVDDLLRNEVLVDLYYVVRQALLIGSRSYSIKKLEPLYMGDDLRDTDGVTTGADSVAVFAQATELLASENPTDQKEAQRALDNIADYNRYDCVSTLRLRDWLLKIAGENGIAPQGLKHERESAKTGEPNTEEEDRSALSVALLEKAALAESQGLADERNLYALAASAIDYHKREQKSFWWEHFERLIAPFEDWSDTKDVFTASGTPLVEADWHRPERARKDRRHTYLPGHFAPGSSVKEGASVFAIYDSAVDGPSSAGLDASAEPISGKLIAAHARVIELKNNGVVIEELAGSENSIWHATPVALTPGAPPHAGTQVTAIAEWGADVLTGKRDGVTETILRTGPNAGALKPRQPADSDDRIPAVLETLLKLEDSVLAVQGPPGTGKTYLAAHVIKQLVEDHAWKIGVVAQSHKVVENVLEGVVKAGLESRLVVKEPQSGSKDVEHGYTTIKAVSLPAYFQAREEQGEGLVVGGTAWLFSNEARIARKSLDLLVIDEAGQFSLAPTMASSVAAKNLLLLGDPRQLPQVSQGSHPEPVDESALGWLSAGRETLPENLGVFLAETWRMRDEVTRVVSKLSYGSKLKSHESSAKLEIQGSVAPGLHWHPVNHESNTTSSKEEAAKVVELVKQTLQATYTLAGTEPKPLTQADVLVVAPYNAQVELVTDYLAKAGFAEVRVGTVDKFQGQEALVAIVTLAASSSAEVPRGLDFLLMPNRLNVAISRAKWAAHLVSSANLSTRGLPTSLVEMRALSGYLMLTTEAIR